MRAGQGAAGATTTPELVMPAKRASRCPAATSAATAVTSAAPSRRGAAFGIASTVDRCLQTGAAKGLASYSWTWQLINKAQFTSFTEGGFVSRSVKQTVPALCARSLSPGKSCGLLAAA